MRGRKKSTISNLSRRRNAEENLINGVYSWRKFLGVVSYTSDSLTERLQQEFSENEELFFQDVETNVENSNQLICSNCNLDIQERYMIGPCGHYNVCFQCIQTIQQSNEPKCPTCRNRILSVIRFQEA